MSMTDTSAPLTSDRIVDKDGFELVQYKKKSTSKISQPIYRSLILTPTDRISASPDSSVSENDPLMIEEIYCKLEHAILKVKSSTFFKSFLEVFSNAVEELQVGYRETRRIKTIVCFALGTLSSRVSRYQFGLLHCIQEQIGCNKVELYDPIFSKLDKSVMITKYGYEILPKNQEGKYEVLPASEDKNLTFFYLPHAEHELMNNLLYSNWTPEQLENCIIVGNSYGFWGFMNGHSKEVSQDFKGCEVPTHPFYYLHLVGELCNEHDIVNNFDHDEIFMQSAVHTFTRDRLKKWKDDDPRWTRYEPPPKVVPVLR